MFYFLIILLLDFKASDDLMATKEISNKYEKTKIENVSELFEEEVLQNRLLEKDFFKGLIQVFLYILLLALILVFAYDYSYVSLKTHSDDYLKSMIYHNTNWTKVLYILKRSSIYIFF